MPKKQTRLPGMKQKHKAQFFHPGKTFDLFVQGPCNSLAHYACHEVATNNLKNEQVVWVESSAGLGKSHLAIAVCHALQNEKSKAVHYTTATKFSTEMVTAIQTNAMNSFKYFYSNICNVLVFENIHMLLGKKKTIEEFSLIVEEFIRMGKIVITTSTMSVQTLADNGLDTQLLSLLRSSIVTSITTPSHKTKAGVIRQLVKEAGLLLPEELTTSIAQQPMADIRQLKSLIFTMCLMAKSQQLEAITDTIVETTFTSIIGLPKTLDSIMIKGIIATEFKVSEKALESRSRKKAIAFPRQVAMYLARKYTAETLATIGNNFNKNHATVLHSIKVVSALLINDTSVQGQLAMLEQKLRKGGFIN
jgi:chromosomal replication initiator protein